MFSFHWQHFTAVFNPMYWLKKLHLQLILSFSPLYTANVDLLKMVSVEILLNFGNYFRLLQLGFWKFLSGIVFLHHYVRTIGLFFSQAHSIWPKHRAFNPDRKSMGTSTFYCVYLYFPKQKINKFPGRKIIML